MASLKVAKCLDMGSMSRHLATLRESFSCVMNDSVKVAKCLLMDPMSKHLATLREAICKRAGVCTVMTYLYYLCNYQSGECRIYRDSLRGLITPPYRVHSNPVIFYLFWGVGGAI